MGLKYRIYNNIQGTISYNNKSIKEYIVVNELDSQLIDLITRKYVISEPFECDEIKEIFEEERKKEKKKKKDKDKDEQDGKTLDED